MYRLFLLIFFIIAYAPKGCLGQRTSQKFNDISANDYFVYEDYNRALIEYLKEYPQNKEDLLLNTRIGYCYLKVNGDKTKGIPFLEYVYNSGNYDKEIPLYLAMGYMYAYDFDKAIEFFNNYREVAPVSDADFIIHQIENCKNAKLLLQKKTDITFVNLGERINSSYPDYYPFITEEEDVLYFTSNRITNARKIKSSDGFFTSDIYFSKERLGSWGKPRSVGALINTEEDEQCVSLSPDGKSMILYIDNVNVNGDLFVSNIEDKNRYFSKAEQLNEPVNLRSLEKNGYITSDGNLLIFSSDRPEGFGQLDLYKSKRLPNGQWGIPTSLGENINTKYDESFPFFDEKNNVLYFSSEGHINMGGFDIFKAKYNPSTETFEKPINMGHPLNTPEDNIGFSITSDGRNGYIGAYKEDSFGDLDIYNVVFNNIDSKKSVIKGIINTDDSLNIKINASVTLFDALTNEEIEEVLVHSYTGKFIFAVTAGSYKIVIKSDGFEALSETINIYDKSSYVFKIEKHFLLHKIVTPNAPPTIDNSSKSN